MKTQKQSIIATAIVAAMFSASAVADDVSSVVDIAQDDVSVNVVNQTFDPKVTIQDYIDAANRENGVATVDSDSVVDNRSRWDVEGAL